MKKKVKNSLEEVSHEPRRLIQPFPSLLRWIASAASACACASFDFHLLLRPCRGCPVEPLNCFIRFAILYRISHVSVL